MPSRKPSDPQGAEDGPGGTDDEAFSDAFHIGPELPEQLLKLYETLLLYKPEERLKIFQEFCLICGERIFPEHACGHAIQVDDDSIEEVVFVDPDSAGE